MIDPIIKTLCYADIFDYPLTESEIYSSLICSRQISKKKFQTQLSRLISLGQVEPGNGHGPRVGKPIIFYFLPGRHRLIQLRQQREIISREKRQRLNHYLTYLQQIPTIEMVYLTGSLAVNNATASDDLDLMLITSSGLLWSSRLFSTLILDILRVRRKPEDTHRLSHANKICPNLFLDLNHLSLPSTKRNLYTAHEVVQAEILFDRHHLHPLFLWKNRWVSKYLAHSPLPKAKPPLQSVNTNPSHYFFSRLDPVFYWPQYWYMNHRRSTEVITKNSAFFHPRNTSQLILSSYNQRLRRYN